MKIIIIIMLEFLLKVKKIIEFSKNDFDQKSDAYKNGEYYKLVKVQHFVNYAVDSAIDGDTTALTLLSNLFKKSDSKVGRSVNALLDEMYYVSKTIRETIQDRYNGNRDEYIKDIDEFAKIYDLSSETSLLGTAFFGLNKGLSTKTEDILNLINKYEKLVSDHEIKFGINSELSNIDAIIDVIIAAKPYLNKDSIRNTLLKA
jgi:hypothetical protein